ncbi:Ring canal kelch isoform 2 [Schistosoma japonicum]|uniref:Ring canal kelch isoform 2 n=1 Tax=Schistosoma japonicum TaxID=6182 RepID=A0A4Z2DSC5_SCHJA|nr:Ring canal kelch isoform 2 [Schistosoma japonicum]
MGPNDICQKLYQQQRDKLDDCNFTLECESHKQLVHKCVIRAVSSKIDQLCIQEEKENITDTTDINCNKQNNIIIIDSTKCFSDNNNNSANVKQLKNSFYLGNISANTLDTFVEYIYKSEITIDEVNASELFNISVLLNIQFIQDSCVDYLKTTLNEDNCLQLMKRNNIINHCEINQLVNECIKYTAKHFDKILDRNDTMNIEPDELFAILEHSEFNVQDEWKLVEFIHLWIKYDYDNRCIYEERLCKYIRFQLLDTIKLLEILENQEMFGFHSNVKKALIDLGRLSRSTAVIKWDRKSNYSLDNELGTDHLSVKVVRNPKVGSEISDTDNLHQTTLICFGGRLYEKRFSSNITCYKIDELKPTINQCKHLFNSQYQDCNNDNNIESFTFPYLKQIILSNFETMPSLRKGFGAVNLNDKIYLVGGRPKHSMQTSNIYYISLGKWFTGQNLNTGRSWYSLSECDNVIYAVGGVGEDDQTLSSVEMLDPRVNKWQTCSSMLRPRFGYGVCSTDNEIIVVGGVSESTIELYDIRSGKWQPLVKMPEVREASSVFIHDDCVYICGGANEAGCVNTTDILSLKTTIWSKGKSMILHRAFAATCIWNNYIFLIGGRNNTEPSNLIQTYNLKTNEWAVLPQTLPCSVSNCCAVTTNLL